VRFFYAHTPKKQTNSKNSNQTNLAKVQRFKGYGFALRNETLSCNRKYDFELKDLAAALMLLYLK